MEPTLHDGQFVTVNKAAYWFGDPKRGDIVIYDAPDMDHDVIHRVIGLPGELVEIRKGQLFIDGEQIDEPYINGSAHDRRIQVGEDNYFLIGDNRRHSTSHEVSRGDIVGKAWLIYWPLSDWGFVSNHSWESDDADEETPELSAILPMLISGKR